MSVCGGGFGCVGVVGSINDAADTCLSGCFTSLSIYLPPIMFSCILSWKRTESLQPWKQVGG